MVKTNTNAFSAHMKLSDILQGGKQVALLYGAEDFLIKEDVDQAKKELIDPAFEAYSFEILEGAAATIDAITNCCGSFPPFGANRLIIIQNPAFLKTRSKKAASSDSDEKEKSSKDIEERFIKVLKNLAPQVYVIILLDTVDRRKIFFKELAKIGYVNEYKPFASWEEDRLIGWIVERFQSEGKKIGLYAARLLVEISGGNLRSLNSEINKICTYAANQETIKEEDIKVLASPGQIEAFDLLDALRRKDKKSALEALNKLFKNKTEPLPLIGLLTTQYRLLLQVKELSQKRVQVRDMAARIGANPFFVRKSSENIASFSLEELIEAMQKLHTADLRLKTVYTDPKRQMEWLVIDLCGVRAGEYN